MALVALTAGAGAFVYVSSVLKDDCAPGPQSTVLVSKCYNLCPCNLLGLHTWGLGRIWACSKTLKLQFGISVATLQRKQDAESNTQGRPALYRICLQ